MCKNGYQIDILIKGKHTSVQGNGIEDEKLHQTFGFA
jgi:hypothetical protein